MSLELDKLSLHGISQALESGNISSVELCKGYLAKVEQIEDKINAFITFDPDHIISQATASDKRRKQGENLSEFDGIPIAVKDVICIKGQPCTCGSKILEPVISPYDATVIKRLRKQGFVFFGQTNMDEFAMGSSCENSAFKKTVNPWDFKRVPGGSSGGSAAAVAAREVPIALGSDTGGSIRQPASFCGIVGLKPTYGRVSRYGLVAYASSLDQIGPLAIDVTDAAIVLDIIGGHDTLDCTSLPEQCTGFKDAVSKINGSLKGTRVGLPREYYDVEGLDKNVKSTIEETIDILNGLGAEIINVSLPHTKYAIASYYIIATAEASTNLARFDGIRYGQRDKNSADLLGTYLQSRGKGFGDEVKRRIILGTYVLSSGYYDAYYLRAQKVRTLIRNDFSKAFNECDVILTPVAPTPAFEFGAKSDPLQMYLEDIFTIALNLSGNCGISIPADLDPDTGTPIGIQFIAPALQEKRLLEVSRAFELNRKIKDFICSLH